MNHFAINFLFFGILALHMGSYRRATKIDCHPTHGATQEKCESLGCIWEPIEETACPSKFPFDLDHVVKVAGPLPNRSQVNEAWCYFPQDYTGYKVSTISEDQRQIYLTRERPSSLPNDVKDLKVTIESFGPKGSMLRLRIEDAHNQRFEPQLPVLHSTNDNSSESMFSVDIDTDGRLVISRKDTSRAIFDTDLTKLIFADQFIQLNSALASPFVYGLGEHYDHFMKLADSYKTYSFFHTDKLPLPDGRRSYGSFPFYVNLDSDRQEYAHGVYLRNSNAMDIVLQTDQSITFRPIGGILDFILFAGPTPNDVVKQFQNLVGLAPLPPRWALGFHLCRYNYSTLDKTRQVWKRTVDAGIPFDVQWNDIDNMDRHNDFTYDKDKFEGLPEFIDELHTADMHYMLLFDPGLSQEEGYKPYELGQQMDIFVKNETNQTLVGKVWNDSGKTVFPDFSNPKSIEFWSKLFVDFQQEIKFDGAWIDMNDISNFVTGSLDGCPSDHPLENPPYVPGGVQLQDHSLCMTAKHQAGYEYNVHNLYAYYEAIATFEALKASRPAKRPFIISRSTSVGQGNYSGHWSGDVASNWNYLKWSIPSLIEHSMYGFTMMGSDICGFFGDTNAELCARWSTLGAFYTFSRNHNDDKSIDQDPVAMGPRVVQANKNGYLKKYSLLPYLYSLVYRQHKFGEPVIRSVPFEFYLDQVSLNVEDQFLWGEALMISPVVTKDTHTKRTYLPKGRWYESNIDDGTNKTTEFEVIRKIDSPGDWYTTDDISLVDLPLFYRGGHIVPFYWRVGRTTVDTADQGVSLKVFLCPSGMAVGELYIDDGDNVDGKYNHITFKVQDKKLTISQDLDGWQEAVKFRYALIYGEPGVVQSVRVDGEARKPTQMGESFMFSLGNVLVSNGKPIVVEWSVADSGWFG